MLMVILVANILRGGFRVIFCTLIAHPFNGKNGGLKLSVMKKIEEFSREIVSEGRLKNFKAFVCSLDI